MPSGRVTHAETGGVHVLRYFGRVDYALAPAIKRFADELARFGEVRAWVFDLTQAELLDSTNLGLLARLGGAGGSVIVSTSDDINSVLRSMSFDRMFDIVDHTAGGPASASEDATIRAEATSPRELGRTMLDAHRALVELSEAGRLQFQDVVAALEADLGE
jgi:anti-anti-sigma factor